MPPFTPSTKTPATGVKGQYIKLALKNVSTVHTGHGV